MTKSHYFYALSLSSEVKHSLLTIANDVKVKFPFKKWVHHEDYHITLVFLGHIEHEKLTKLNQQIEASLTDSTSVSLSIHGFGTFGKNDAPRIFWTGIKHSEPLFRLQKVIYEQCVKNGLELDKRPYNPHITLARKWDSDQPFKIENLLHYNAQVFQELIDNIQDVTLFRTHLDQSPKYEKIRSFKLRNDG